MPMIVQLAATLVTQATRNATTSMDRFVAYANTVTRKYQTRRNANVRKYTLSFVLKLINRNVGMSYAMWSTISMKTEDSVY